MATMHRRLLAGFIALLGVSMMLLPGMVHGQAVQDFSFDSFDADYYLSRQSDQSSTLKVEETLVAEFPSSDQNHGILRAIPERYKNHSLHLSNISVSDGSGTEYSYTTYRENDNLVLKIGDANTYVHGKKTYRITYQLQDVVSFYKDHDEFFWDINGDQWEQTFGEVTARIHIPNELKSAFSSRQRCYKGLPGDTAQDCTISAATQPEEILVLSKAQGVGPGQTLSAVLAFAPGSFIKSPAQQQEEQSLLIGVIVSAAILLLLPAVTFVVMFRRWRQFGNDPRGRGVIIPEYAPPKGFDPINADYLMKEAVRPVAISATIVDAAIKRYVTIYETKEKGFLGRESKDYELELKSSPEALSANAQDALRMIFNAALTPGTRVKVSDFSTKRTTMYKKMQDLRKSLAKQLFEAGYFQKNPAEIAKSYLVKAGLLFAAAVASGFVGSLATSLWFLWAVAVGLAASAFITLIFSFIMPARSEQGMLALDSLKGLKDYIKLAEAERLQYLQSPEGAEKVRDPSLFNPEKPDDKVKLFEKLLPFAMLFGLEKEWGKQFEGLYATQPDWYQGSNVNAFSAGYLAGSLSDFSSSANSSFSPPSSSSGSGFSGGGAGGGGGGGGGGGW